MIIPIILIALLIVGTFAFVFRPLFVEYPRGAQNPQDAKHSRKIRKERGEGPVLGDGAQVDELVARRDALYAALKDAEFDRETGKLTDEDYQIVRTRYMAEAAQVLRQFDRLTPEAKAALDSEIEQGVAQVRSDLQRGDTAGQADLAAAVEGEIAALIKHAAPADKRRLACPNCGRRYLPGDAFCAACGAPLADDMVSKR